MTDSARARKPTRPRLPRYVNVFTDRHGRERSYFRRGGIRIALHGEVGGPEWWRAYSDALAGHPAAAPRLPAAPRVRAGSVASVIAAVLGSAEYARLRASSRRSYARPVEVLRKLIGDMPIARLTREHWVRVVEAQRRQSVNAGNATLKLCRVVVRHALLLGLIETDPIAGLHKQGPQRRGGHHTWLAAEAAEYRKHHKLGTLARLVFELAHETGLRRSDLVRIGRQHVAGDMIRITPTKTSDRTGAVATIPVTAELRAALDLVPRDRLTFIVGADGRPVTADHLGWRFAQWCGEAGLPDCCRLHGLRKALGSRLATLGADMWEIGAVLADRDPASLKIYVEGRDTDALAKRAGNRLERTETGKVTNLQKGLSKRRAK